MFMIAARWLTGSEVQSSEPLIFDWQTADHTD